MTSHKSMNQIRPAGNKVILPALNHKSVYDLPKANKVDAIFKMPGAADSKRSRQVDRTVYELPKEMNNS